LKKARIYELNISRITESALLSILDFFETKNSETSFLGEASFSKEGSLVGSLGFEPKTSGDISTPAIPPFSILSHNWNYLVIESYAKSTIWQDLLAVRE